jgi:hypothetical protein
MLLFLKKKNNIFMCVYIGDMLVDYFSFMQSDFLRSSGSGTGSTQPREYN